MNRTEIFEKLNCIADRYGFSNPQQFKQMSFVLGKNDSEEVFWGIHRILSTDCEEKLIRQEFAGRLLAEVNPQVSLELEVVISSALEAWDVSVQEFPLFLRDQFGLEKVLNAISEIEKQNLSKAERNNLETFRWWLGAITDD